MSDLNSEILAWLEVAKGGPGSGAQDGHPFRGNQYKDGSDNLKYGGFDKPTRAFAAESEKPFGGNQYPPKSWGDKNNTPSALKDITAADHASSWNQVPMTDTAAKIMEAESRHPDMEKAVQGKPEMTNDERSADAIPKWLVDKATPADLDALTDNNFHSSVRYIESQRPDLIQKSVSEIAKGGQGSGAQLGHKFNGNQYVLTLGGHTYPAIKREMTPAKAHDRMYDYHMAKATEARTAGNEPLAKLHFDAAGKHNEASISQMSPYGNTVIGDSETTPNDIATKTAWDATDKAEDASANAEKQAPSLSIGKAVVAKGDVDGHAFHGNQWTGGNAGAHFDGYRPMEPSQTIAQIGKMNILGISGGRVERLNNSNGETVGIRLPVSKGYAVNVLLHPNDTYTVQRTYTRSGTTTVKGQEDGVYADQIGDAAYRAGMYVNVPFGGHKGTLG